MVIESSAFFHHQNTITAKIDAGPDPFLGTAVLDFGESGMEYGSVRSTGQMYSYSIPNGKIYLDA